MLSTSGSEPVLELVLRRSLSRNNLMELQFQPLPLLGCRVYTPKTFPVFRLYEGVYV